MCVCYVCVCDQKWPSPDSVGTETKRGKLDHLLTRKYFKKSETLFIQFNVCVYIFVDVGARNVILFCLVVRFYLLNVSFWLCWGFFFVLFF